MENPAEIVTRYTRYIVRCKSNHNVCYDICNSREEAEKSLAAVLARKIRLANEQQLKSA